MTKVFRHILVLPLIALSISACQKDEPQGPPIPQEKIDEAAHLILKEHLVSSLYVKVNIDLYVADLLERFGGTGESFQRKARAQSATSLLLPGLLDSKLSGQPNFKPEKALIQSRNIITLNRGVGLSASTTAGLDIWRQLYFSEEFVENRKSDSVEIARSLSNLCNLPPDSVEVSVWSKQMFEESIVWWGALSYPLLRFVSKLPRPRVPGLDYKQYASEIFLSFQRQCPEAIDLKNKNFFQFGPSFALADSLSSLLEELKDLVLKTTPGIKVNIDGKIKAESPKREEFFRKKVAEQQGLVKDLSFNDINQMIYHLELINREVDVPYKSNIKGSAYKHYLNLETRVVLPALAAGFAGEGYKLSSDLDTDPLTSPDSKIAPSFLASERFKKQNKEFRELLVDYYVTFLTIKADPKGFSPIAPNQELGEK
ncbi:MAG: hypothetical protein KDD61_00270, partial [Bdellovibrionales bacterium]|nr:hypothetical protein [Bdellovibrionales bacterium]